MRILSACIAFLVFLFSSTAQAANWYVNAAASGSNNGSDWTNAWHDFDHATGYAAGDTIWIAGGTYVQDLVINADGTSGSRIYFKRARTTDSECTSASGWSASYDSQVVLTKKRIVVGTDSKGNYTTVDGRIASGIYLDYRTQGTASFGAVQNPGAITNFTLRYVEIEGPGKTTFFDQDARGVDLTGNFISSDILLEYLKIHGLETSIDVKANNVTVQYSEFYDIGSGNPAVHPNIAYFFCSNTNGNISNLTYRFNTAHDYAAEGVFIDMGVCDNVQIYGNVFYEGYKTFDTDGDDAHTNVLIYNNTFDTVTYLPRFEKTGQTGEYKNNAALNASNSVYVAAGATMTQATNWAGSSDPGFANQASRNYRLLVSASSLINTGTDLGSPYNADNDGVSRPQGAAWDIGAYEYVAYPTATIGAGPTWTLGTGATATIH